VGYRSAQSFFSDQGDTVNARLAGDRLHDEMVLGEFYEALTERLNRLYVTRPDSAALATGRADAGVWAREQLTGPVGARLRTFKVANLPDRPVNNARLIGARIYRTRLDLFDRWFDLHAHDVRSSVSALGALMEGVEGDSAYARLERAVTDTMSNAPATVR
jgi:hypothetical protein